jgi:hypothetical protein
MGKSAIAPLIDMLRDKHPAIRVQIIEILGSTGDAKAKNSCKRVLRDPDENVRWRGVLSSQKCGVSVSHLPLELSQRIYKGPSVIGATIMNFFFLGVGYDYLEKWWGLVILEIYMLFFFISQLLIGIVMTIIIMVPFMTLFAVHTYFMAKREAVLHG